MPEQSEWAMALHRAINLADALDAEPAINAWSITISDDAHASVVLERFDGS